MTDKRGFARLIAICALAAAVILLLAACGASTSSGTVGSESTSASGAGSSGGSSSGGGTTIKVTEKEFSITPSDISAKAGKITFEIKNTGSVAHDLAVDVGGTPQTSTMVQPGKTESWTVTISTAGDYQIYCTVPGHKEAGMKGTLKITS